MSFTRVVVWACCLSATAGCGKRTEAHLTGNAPADREPAERDAVPAALDAAPAVDAGVQPQAPAKTGPEVLEGCPIHKRGMGPFADAFAAEPRFEDWASSVEKSIPASLAGLPGTLAKVECRCRCCRVEVKGSFAEAETFTDKVQEERDQRFRWATTMVFGGDPTSHLLFYPCR